MIESKLIFVCLTTTNGDYIRINAEYIVFYHNHETGSCVKLKDNSLVYVIETPNQIDISLRFLGCHIYGCSNSYAKTT